MQREILIRQNCAFGSRLLAKRLKRTQPGLSYLSFDTTFFPSSKISTFCRTLAKCTFAS